MGFIEWLRGHRAPSSNGEAAPSSGKIPRFTPVSENDEMLGPWQIEFIKRNLAAVETDILQTFDPNDPMLPECAFFLPNLLAEFRENPRLAMIHGLGTAHAWIDVGKLREVFAAAGDEIQDYRDLFRAFVARGYDVRKIKYIYFRSQMRARS